MVSFDLTALPVNDRLNGKWEEAIHRIPGRVVVQNLQSGECRQFASAQAGHVCAPVARTGKHQIGPKEQPSVWRRVESEEEADALWRVQAYLDYYHFSERMARTNYVAFAQRLAALGGVHEIDDIELLETPAERDRARQAQDMAGRRDVERERRRKSAENIAVIEGWLREYVRPLYSDRDVAWEAASNSDVIRQEQIRERARQLVRGDAPSRKDRTA